MNFGNELAAWFRVRTRLRCGEAAEQPQWFPFDLRGLIKTVCKTAFTFHSAGGPLPRFRSVGRDYELEILLPQVAEKEAREFVGRWRNLPHRSYVILECSEPERRSLADLLAEQPWLGAREVCLDFETPLVMDAVPEGAPAIGPSKLLRLLEARAKYVLGGLPYEGAGPAMMVLPWYLKNSRPEVRKSRSQPGHREVVSGLRGSLFVRGELEEAWPLLVLAEELHFGRTLAAGAGRFRLRKDVSMTDQVLLDSGIWSAEVARLREDPEHREVWNGPTVPNGRVIGEMLEDLKQHRFPAEPATRISIPKTSGGSRTVGRLEPATYLLHRVLGRVLLAPLEARLPVAAIAYRPRRGVGLARPFLSHAIDAGCTHVAKTDITAFFDEIPWVNLRQAVDAFLPVGDGITRSALETVWSLPYRDGARTAGVLQGSPLSPMLANLYLAPWDDALAERGYRHIRYGDDLLIAAAGEEEARLALAEAGNLLSKLGLRLNPDKTEILPIAEGFHHLGLDLGGDDGDIVETAKPALRRTLYLTKSEEWAGLDHGAILIRDGTRLVHRLPLIQISNIVLFGIGGVSSALVAACMHRHIPLTFADHSGHHCGTLHPEPRTFYTAVAKHASARQTLDAAQVALVAREIVADKLSGYRLWAESLLPPFSGLLRKAAESGCATLQRETDLPATLGVEGSAARALFRAVNDQCQDPFWKSERRGAHERRDPWNLLIDTLSFLLFTRINFLVRAAGLDPYQGFLHSPHGRFESLVCDLQEPFRARIERLAVRLANLKMVRIEHAIRHPDKTWTWTSEGWRSVITEFETELDRRRGQAPVTWRTSIHHLVEGLQLWTREPDRHFPWHRNP